MKTPPLAVDGRARLSARGACWLTAFLVFVFPFAIHTSRLLAQGLGAGQDPPGNSLGVLQKLNSIRLLRVYFMDTALQEALSTLAKESRAADPDKRGVNIVLETPDDATVKDARVTLFLRNVTVLQALRCITDLTSTYPRLQDDSVIVGKAAMKTRMFSVKRAVFQAVTERTGDKTPPSTKDHKFLEEFGITFPPGTSARYDSALQLLTVTHTAEVLEQIEQCLMSFCHEPPKVTFELHLVDAPADALGALAEQNTRQGLDPTWLAKVRELERSKRATCLRSLRFTTVSGDSARQSMTREFSYVGSYKVEKGIAIPIFDTRELGTVLELKVFANPNDFMTLNVTLSFEGAELKLPIRKAQVHLPGTDRLVPVERPEFLTRKYSSSLIMSDNATVLLGAFDPFPGEVRRPEGRKILALLNVRLVDHFGVPIRGAVSQAP